MSAVPFTFATEEGVNCVRWAQSQPLRLSNGETRQKTPFFASTEPAKVATGFELGNCGGGNGLERIRFLSPFFNAAV
jgi:hypothetical protein